MTTMRNVVLDTETTGFQKKGDDITEGHRIIEIGCVEMNDGQLTGRTYHAIINPEQNISKESTNIHGITNSMVKNKPKFKDICDSLLKFLKDSTIIIHNAPFDIAFLNKEFSLLKKKHRPLGTFYYIDTLPLARNTFPGQPNTLKALSQRLGFNMKLHNALTDAAVLGCIYSELWTTTTTSTGISSGKSKRKGKEKSTCILIA